jgi:hypothetical protein
MHSRSTSLYWRIVQRVGGARHVCCIVTDRSATIRPQERPRSSSVGKRREETTCTRFPSSRSSLVLECSFCCHFFAPFGPTLLASFYFRLSPSLILFNIHCHFMGVPPRDLHAPLLALSFLTRNSTAIFVVSVVTASFCSAHSSPPRCHVLSSQRRMYTFHDLPSLLFMNWILLFHLFSMGYTYARRMGTSVTG